MCWDETRLVLGKDNSQPLRDERLARLVVDAYVARERVVAGIQTLRKSRLPEEPA